MIRARGSGKCCNRNAMRWKATFRAPFNGRGCAYVRVLSFKERWVCYHYLTTPKMLCYPFFCRRFIEDACWVWNDGFLPSIHRFFLFLFFLKVKFLRWIKTFHRVFQIVERILFILHISYTARDETCRICPHECKWFGARIVITDKTKIEYDRSRCYWLHRPFTATNRLPHTINICIHICGYMHFRI